MAVLSLWMCTEGLGLQLQACQDGVRLQLQTCTQSWVGQVIRDAQGVRWYFGPSSAKLIIAVQPSSNQHAPALSVIKGFIEGLLQEGVRKEGKSASKSIIQYSSAQAVTFPWLTPWLLYSQVYIVSRKYDHGCNTSSWYDIMKLFKTANPATLYILSFPPLGHVHINFLLQSDGINLLIPMHFMLNISYFKSSTDILHHKILNYFHKEAFRFLHWIFEVILYF